MDEDAAEFAHNQKQTKTSKIGKLHDESTNDPVVVKDSDDGLWKTNLN